MTHVLDMPERDPLSLENQSTMFPEEGLLAPEAREMESYPAEPSLEDGRDLLEVLIFAAEEPVDTPRLAALLERSEPEILVLVERLNADYLAQGRSFELRRLAGGWQLVARTRYAPLLSRLLKEMVRPRLSRAALETLAVAAFRQPVTKGEIEAVRGVKADAVLRTLLERNLLMIAGRSEGVGRPLLYRTTKGFLEAFGLASLQELPRLKEIQAWLKGPRDRGPEDLPPLWLQPLTPPEAPLAESAEAAEPDPHPAEPVAPPEQSGESA
jgi:segregation and condensation protein B